MGLDLDPFYYTETMVKILREQGHTQLAMELAELILEKNGEHPGVRALFEELKTDARRAFERFKNSGRGNVGEVVVEASLADEVGQSEPVDFPIAAQTETEIDVDLVGLAEAIEAVEPEIEAAIETEVEAEAVAAAPEAPVAAIDPIVEIREPVRLTLVSDRSAPGSRIELLQSILERIQQRRQKNEIRQA